MPTETLTRCRVSRRDWETKRREHQQALFPFVERRRTRRSRGQRHAVEDFLWEYYQLRGSRLLTWHPGPGVTLEEAGEAEFPHRLGYRETTGGRSLDVGEVLRRRASGIRWIRNLLETIDARPLYLGCLGLHEWAMVYEERDIRHPQVPLRLSHAETRRVVDSLPLRCTHYDAFRFFSGDAVPLNATALTPENRVAHEQPGCLHANMDLLKWTLKLEALVPSSLTRECFDLACRAREVDMRASPYDVRGYGLEPIAIETPAGRAAYVQMQQQIAEDARPLRRTLIRILKGLD